MKKLCTFIAVLATAAAAAGSASAQTNQVTFNEAQGGDGLWHIDVTVTYVFPGQGPRVYNTGAGTVRVSLPGAEATADPGGAADPGYNCAPSDAGIICSNDGTANGNGGLNFPASVTLHLVAKSCWAGAPNAAADVWSAPNDPGVAPDVSLPITSGGDCSGDGSLQPVMPPKPKTCRVPVLTGRTLSSAGGRLHNAHCARGTVTFKTSKKVKKGSVIAQAVKPGKLLKENAKVNLVVSKGP